MPLILSGRYHVTNESKRQLFLLYSLPLVPTTREPAAARLNLNYSLLAVSIASSMCRRTNGTIVLFDAALQAR
jgi:hypothetical protein